MIDDLVDSKSVTLSCEYIAAVYTYYRTLAQERSAKRRGKDVERNTARRRRERLLRVRLPACKPVQL